MLTDNNNEQDPEPFGDYTPMPFGKHRGTLLKDVPGKYLLKLKDEGTCAPDKNPELYNYIIDNIDLITKEAGNPGSPLFYA